MSDKNRRGWLDSGLQMCYNFLHLSRVVLVAGVGFPDRIDDHGPRFDDLERVS